MMWMLLELKVLGTEWLPSWCNMWKSGLSFVGDGGLVKEKVFAVF